MRNLQGDIIYISVSAGIKKDWWDYRCALYQQANSSLLTASAVGLSVVGLVSLPVGVVATVGGIGITISSSTKNNKAEELTNALYGSGAADNDLVVFVSEIMRSFEDQYTMRHDTFDRNRYAYRYDLQRAVVDNSRSYWFFPAMKRIVY